MQPSLPIALAVVFLCSACGTLPWSPRCDPDTRACDELWVGVVGSPDFDVELHVFGQVWAIPAGGGGGVVSVEVVPDVPVDVRLVETEACSAIVEFPASGGSAWVIRFVAEGAPRVEDWTGEGHDDGPALEQARATECEVDRLPRGP
jgi:hypothetical protein